MFRLWAKILRNNRIIKDTVICNNNPNIKRTQKIFQALDTVCYEFDLEKPIWLDKNIEEFKYLSKVRFTTDNFIETIAFDYLEIQVIEED